MDMITVDVTDLPEVNIGDSGGAVGRKPDGQ